MKTIIKIARRLTQMPQTQDFSKLLSLDNVHFPFDQLLRKLLQCLRTILAILPHLIPSFQHQPLAFSACLGRRTSTRKSLCKYSVSSPSLRPIGASTAAFFQGGEKPGAAQKISGSPAKTKEDIRFDPDPGCSLRLLAFQVSESFMQKELILNQSITLLTSAFNSQK